MEIKNYAQDYSEYNSLNDYEKKTLCATNYWRVINGKEVIPVPDSDEHYKKYFDKRCYEVRKQNIEWENRKNSKDYGVIYPPISAITKPVILMKEEENKENNQISLF
jgi:hypothetical protein